MGSVVGGTVPDDAPVAADPDPYLSGRPSARGCPLLVAADGPSLGEGVGPDSCEGFQPPLRLSASQVSLVCTTTRHAHCPRYLGRGPAAGQLPTLAVPRAAAGRPRLHVASLAAAVVLGLAVVATVGFSLVHGGLELGASPAPGATRAAAGVVSPSPAAPTASVATPAPSFSPLPTASSAPTPGGSFAALLTACPDRPACYLYRVRAGDSLGAIAATFGVAVADIRRMNPQITNPSLIHVGEQVALPPPTR